MSDSFHLCSACISAWQTYKHTRPDSTQMGSLNPGGAESPTGNWGSRLGLTVLVTSRDKTICVGLRSMPKSWSFKIFESPLVGEAQQRGDTPRCQQSTGGFHPTPSNHFLIQDIVNTTDMLGIFCVLTLWLNKIKVEEKFKR